MSESETHPTSMPERDSGRVRLEYGAVPLRPWQAVHPDSRHGEGYYLASLHHITDKLHMNIRRFRDRIRVDDRHFDELEEFVGSSLVDAQNRRVMFNDSRTLPEDLDTNNEIVDAALKGTATPSELLGLLIEYPELGSIELAKLSHPFDFDETTAMESAITDALGDKHAEVPSRNNRPRYKLKRLNGPLMAMVLVRKRSVGCISTDNGKIEVIERKSLLTIDNDDVRMAEHYATELNNGHEPEEAITFVRGAIERRLVRGDLQNTEWLFPTTTSYYARLVPERT